MSPSSAPFTLRPVAEIADDTRSWSELWSALAGNARRRLRMRSRTPMTNDALRPRSARPMTTPTTAPHNAMHRLVGGDPAPVHHEALPHDRHTLSRIGPALHLASPVPDLWRRS